MKKIFSATLDGYSSCVVEVEVSFIKALPSFSVVGLASSAIQESKDRVKSALIYNNFKFPPKKITVNLAPSDLHKSGSHFDLAIAILIALQNEEIDLKDWFIFGELGLDGRVKDTFLIFPLILSLIEQNLIKKVIVPISSIDEAIDFIKEDLNINRVDKEPLSFKSIDVQNERYFYENSYELDYIDVKGQENAKRAALICACGMHNVILEGSPGCGKSMIIKRLSSILPPLSLNEILQICKNEALDKEEFRLSAKRPLRACHHSSTKSSILGGGSLNAKAGEVALSHLGILFFDELPHFSKNILEALREPLEDKKILVSRVNSKVEYETNFMFCAALNPCPCGNLFSKDLECRCSEIEIKRYKNKISEPFLDRIDVYVKMQEVTLSDAPTISSKDMHDIVIKSFIAQKNRGQNVLNSNLNDHDIEKFCILEDDAKAVLSKAIESFSLTNRGVNKIKKVARTIADINSHDIILKQDVLEALSFRKRD